MHTHICAEETLPPALGLARGAWTLRVSGSLAAIWVPFPFLPLL